MLYYAICSTDDIPKRLVRGRHIRKSGLDGIHAQRPAGHTVNELDRFRTGQGVLRTEPVVSHTFKIRRGDAITQKQCAVVFAYRTGAEPHVVPDIAYGDF